MPVALKNQKSLCRGVGFSRALAFIFLAVALAALGGCVGRNPAQNAPVAPVSPEALLDVSGAPLPPRVFDASLARADYVLIGEEHPNPCDHLAQAGIIRRLATSGVRPVIGLEMIPADLQEILDAFNDGKLAVADLPRALSWKTTWGYAFEIYAPIFEAARDLALPVFALNTPKGLARKVGREGPDALPPAERATLPGTILPPDPAQVEQLRELFAHHATMIKKGPKASKAPKTRTERDPFAGFLTVQSLWDTQMAARAVLAHARYSRPVVIIAGGGHVERGWGIARRLAVLDPEAKVVTVMPWRGGETPDPALAQTFFACPVVHKSRLGMTLAHEATAPGNAPAPLLVTAVTPGSPAATAGLLAGDAVTAAGKHAATGLFTLHKAAAEAAKAGEPLTLTISRAGEILTLTIPLGTPPAAK